MYSLVYYVYMFLCFIGAVACISSICKGKSDQLVYTKNHVVVSHAISVTVYTVFASMVFSGWLLVLVAVSYSIYAYLISLRKLSIGSTVILVPDFIRILFRCLAEAAVLSFIYYGSINQWFSTISASSLYQWASALPTSG